MSTAEYGDWQMAATISVPIGRRAAFANEHAAQLQTSRERGLLQQAALTTAHQLGDTVRQIHYSYQQYHEAELRLRAADDWLKEARVRYQNPLPADENQNWLLQTLHDYLVAVRFRTDAATDAAALLAKYNSQLVRLEEAKGTLLAFFDIDLANDPCAQVRTIRTTPFGCAAATEERLDYTRDRLSPPAAAPALNAPEPDSLPIPADRSTEPPVDSSIKLPDNSSVDSPMDRTVDEPTSDGPPTESQPPPTIQRLPKTDDRIRYYPAL